MSLIAANIIPMHLYRCCCRRRRSELLHIVCCPIECVCVCVSAMCTRVIAVFHSETYLFRLLGWLAVAVRICPLRSLLVQRLLIACLEMIIIVDAIKHFVIKRISLVRRTMPMPIHRLAFKSLMSVFLLIFLLLFPSPFLRLFRLFFVVVVLFFSSAVLFCYTLLLLRKSLLVL